MRALYQHPTEAQLEEVVQEVENGHGGKVDFPEFIEILVSYGFPMYIVQCTLYVHCTLYVNCRMYKCTCLDIFIIF